jgi:hypothetical protein
MALIAKPKMPKIERGDDCDDLGVSTGCCMTGSGIELNTGCGCGSGIGAGEVGICDTGSDGFIYIPFGYTFIIRYLLAKAYKTLLLYIFNSLVTIIE